MGAISRFGTRGSIKAHHFYDRLIGVPLFSATTSLTGSTYQVVWSATPTFSPTVALSLTPVTGTCFAWMPQPVNSSLWVQNAYNYNWAKLGNFTLTFSPIMTSLPQTGSTQSIANGEYILSNNKIALEYLPTAGSASSNTFSGVIPSVNGYQALSLYNYSQFQDNPETVRKPLTRRDYVCKHKYVQSATVAVPHILNAVGSGGAVNATNQWNMAYSFKKAAKMPVPDANQFYYRPTVFYLPAPTASGWVPIYDLIATFDFWLIDPN